MRLTNILLIFKKRPPRGKVDIGKHRYPVVIEHYQKSQALQDLQIEETNMLYLRYPYLTFEESYGHAAALGKRKAFVDEKNRLRYLEAMKKKPHVQFEDRYGMLKNNDFWD